MGASLVDWGLAGRTARALARPGEDAASSWVPEQAEMERTCDEALAAAAEYTGLEAREPPRAELVGRAQWANAALGTLADASSVLEERFEAQVRLPGPFGAGARRLVGAAAGIEAGVAIGYAARRVLGQYDVALVGPPRRPRLFLVGANLTAARDELGAPPVTLLRWIALHETTHVLQFQGVPWLEDHLRSLVSELLEGAATTVDLGDLARRLLRTDPRRMVRSVLQGELAEALVGDEQRETLDRLQATMAAVEGHAEHVMDARGALADPAIPRLRRRLEERRRSRGGLGEAIARLLGLEAKLRQYRLGKAFCDTIAARGGERALRELWSSPASLPSLAELERPELWLDHRLFASA